MNVDRALSQLGEIHAHLSRTEVYRGMPARSVAATACLAILGAGLQRFIVTTPQSFLWWWVGIAALAIAIGGGSVLKGYLRTASTVQRRTSRQTVTLFAPAIAGGLVVTAGGVSHPDLIAMLPGTWCVLFAMGILAAATYLPREMNLVGVWYFCCGAFMLMTGVGLSPWGMGISFAAGQAAAATILHLRVERTTVHD